MSKQGDRLKYCPDCFLFLPVSLDICSDCGYPFSDAVSPLYLKPQIRLRKRYLIGRVLGHGGFGVTYLAYDMQNEQKVAIKEYFPKDYAARVSNHATIVPYAGQSESYYEYGKQRFIEEARLLSMFSHPNIVQVKDLMEAFGTVYFVMEYLDGQLIKECIQEQGPMDMVSVKNIVLQLLGALEEVHAKNVLHRDIKPHNIFITSSGRPVLIDFGSARQQFANVSQSLTTILTPGYAPVEQYSRQGQQGPWSDIYALAATAYYMLTGAAPPEAQDMMLGYEKLVPPSQRRPDICEVEEEWLLQSLQIQKEGRPQNVVLWRKLILPYQVQVPAPPALVSPPDIKGMTRFRTGDLAGLLPASLAHSNHKPVSKTKFWVGLLLLLLILGGTWWLFRQSALLEQLWATRLFQPIQMISGV